MLNFKRPLGVAHSAMPFALLPTVTTPRLSYYLSSAIVSRQWLDYFSDQCAFVESLPQSIRNALIVRIYHGYDYGWDQLRRWRDRFPGLRIDEGRIRIERLIRESRLYISTYNATTYLESFAMNVPTVIYWNPRHWELRDSAVPHFDDLRRVGIFHDSPESAARHVASIWENVDAWWSRPDVRAAKEAFSLRYCDLPKDLLARVGVALSEAGKESTHSSQ
jgi:putative transferase (TIGR04331 family)